MRLYLVRHGQTAWNAEEKAQGHTDIPLDDKGIRQAACLAEALSGIPIDLILSSDLQRSLKTAEAVAAAHGIPIEATPLLRERSFGIWEGMPYAEIGRLSGNAVSEQGLRSLYEACPEGGESLQMTWDRIKAMTERLREQAGNTLVVAHGGVCSLMLSQLIRGDLDTSRAFRFHNCAITELMRRPDRSFQLVQFNNAFHLESAEPLNNAAIR
jgi:2,3-bisphosphoglycerate-dependent phosphoglycerate mutase